MATCSVNEFEVLCIYGEHRRHITFVVSNTTGPNVNADKHAIKQSFKDVLKDDFFVQVFGKKEIGQ